MKPHRTDPVSLVAGLVFLGAAGLWLTTYLRPLPVAAVGVLVVGALILLAGLGLFSAIISSRRSR